MSQKRVKPCNDANQINKLIPIEEANYKFVPPIKAIIYKL